MHLILMSLFLSSFSAFALETTQSLLVASNESLYPAILREEKNYICEISRDYGVYAPGLAYILRQQADFYKITDRFQDYKILKLQDLDEGSLELFFKKTLEEDLKREEEGTFHPSRNSFNHWLFSSVGPAQIQIYLGLRLREYVVDGEKRFPTILSVAKALVKKETAIEFLAAELLMMDTLYQKAQLDLSQNPEAQWQLHQSGSIPQRAMARKRDTSGKNPPLLRKVKTYLDNYCAQSP